MSSEIEVYLEVYLLEMAGFSSKVLVRTRWYILAAVFKTSFGRWDLTLNGLHLGKHGEPLEFVNLHF